MNKKMINSQGEKRTRAVKGRLCVDSVTISVSPLMAYWGGCRFC